MNKSLAYIYQHASVNFIRFMVVPPLPRTEITRKIDFTLDQNPRFRSIELELSQP